MFDVNSTLKISLSSPPLPLLFYSKKELRLLFSTEFNLEKKDYR